MIGFILAVSGVLISIVLLLHIWKGIPYGQLTRDLTTIAGTPLYAGFLSRIGNCFWFAAAAVCMFSAAVLSRSPESIEVKRFLFVFGLLTLVLGLDDAFLLHEGLRSFGIPEILVFSGYAGFVLFCLVRFISIILKTEYVLLGMALAFFGISITLDLLQPRGLNPYLFEDGAKLAGIVSWLSYFSHAGAFAVHRHMAGDTIDTRS
jgi:hypothetical protein